MVVAQRAAQREALERPLILNVEAAIGHPVFNGTLTGIDIDPRGHRPERLVEGVGRVIEARVAARRRRRSRGVVTARNGRVIAILQARVAGAVAPCLRENPTVISDLEVVRTGDVGDRGTRAPVVEIPRFGQAAQAVGDRSRRHAKDGEVRRVERARGVQTDGRTEFIHPRNVRIGLEVAMVREVVKLPVHRQARFEEDGVRQRIRPRGLHQPGRMHLTGPPAVARRPGRHGAVARILAGQPLVPEEVDLVLLRRLERDAHVGVARHVHQLQRLE